MSRLIRFFSRRRTDRGVQKHQEHLPKKGYVLCKVLLLDGSDVAIEVPVSIKHTYFLNLYAFLFSFCVVLRHKFSAS